MKKLFIFLLLANCVSSAPNPDKNSDLNFDKDLSFSEFNNLLKVYNLKSPYPDINK